MALSKSSRSFASTLTPALAVKIVNTRLAFSNSYGSLLASSDFKGKSDTLDEASDAGGAGDGEGDTNDEKSDEKNPEGTACFAADLISNNGLGLGFGGVWTA